VIWLGLLILVGLVALICVVDWHLSVIGRQVGALGQLLGSIDARIADSEALLRDIARDTDKMPKVPKSYLSDWDDRA
jgi:hypothetical protein